MLLVESQRADDSPASILGSPPVRLPKVALESIQEFIILLAATHGDLVNAACGFTGSSEAEDGGRTLMVHSILLIIPSRRSFRS